MTLDNETFSKVLGLFPNMPYTDADYCGCWSDKTVSFTVGVQDQYHNTIAGVYVTITQDFKIVKVERLYTTVGRYTRKQPLRKFKIPLHPLGTIPACYA